MKNVTRMIKGDTITRTKELIVEKKGTENKIPWSIIAKEHDCRENVQMLDEVDSRSDECKQHYVNSI